MNGTDVRSAAQRVNDHPATSGLARLGYIASGVLHVVLGLLALQLAWSATGASADQSGALAVVAEQPLGVAALWVVAAGFAGLTLWHVTEAFGGGSGAGDRAKAIAKAVLYGALTWTAIAIAQGASTSGEQQSDDATAQLMAKPGGRWAVALIGLVVLGVAVYHLHKGWTRKFLQDLTGHPGRFVVAAGRLGYVAKAVALGVVGGLFVAAAWHARPDEAGGLDSALRTLREQPFGAVLLTVVAVGFVAYGVYSFARARYART